MAKLDHQNVVKVYAVDSQKGIHFAAIEYVDGKSAQDWLDQLGKFAIGDALNITLAATTGLKAAHDQGMFIATSSRTTSDYTVWHHEGRRLWPGKSSGRR